MGTPRKTREEIQQEEEAIITEKFLRKYHLILLDENDLLAVKEIAIDLRGTAFLKPLQVFNMPVGERFMTSYLAAIVKQNFIVIRKLDELVKKLDK